MGRGQGDPGRGSARCSTRRPSCCLTSGTSWSIWVGRAWPCPRPTAGRASAWPSCAWCSRSWAGRCCRGRCSGRPSPPPRSTGGANATDALGGLARRCTRGTGPAIGPATSRAARSRVASRWSGTVRWPGGSSSRSRTVTNGPGTCSRGTTSPSTSAPASTRHVVWPASRWPASLSSRTAVWRTLRPEVARLATLLAAAEGLGVADWCVSTAGDLCRRPGAVRSADRPVPGGQAPLRRHAHEPRDGARRGVGCGPRRRRGGCQLAPGGRHRRRARTRGRVPLRQGLRPGAGRHRLHVGARCAPVPEAGDRDAPPAPSARPLAGRRRRRHGGW